MRKLIRGGWGVLSALLLASPALAGDARADEARAHEAGRRLYLTGKSSPDRPILARVGAAGVRVPAERLPCGNCHGKDRRGSREGGLVAPDIRWQRLSIPQGESRPAYRTEDLLAVVTTGVAPGGRTLSPAMPRYELAPEDAADLLAFLGSAEEDPVPGVAPDRLTIGLLLPKGQSATTEGEAIAALVRAVFAEVDQTGGVFGRRLALDIRAEGDDLGEWPVLAVLSMLPHRHPPAALTEAGVPVLALQPPDGEPPRRVFFVLPGLRQEALGLLLHHDRSVGRPQHPVVLHGPDPRLAEVAAAAADFAARLGWPVPEIVDLSTADPVGLARRLEAAGADAVLALGGQGRLASLLRASPTWEPHVLLSGSAEGASLSAVPADARAPISAAFGLLPLDWSGPDSRRFRALHDRLSPGRGIGVSTAAAHTMARLLVEAVTRSGRALDREKLASTLERLGDFASGSTPPLRLRPGHPTGVQGSHIVRLDPGAGRMAGPPVWMSVP